MQKVMLRDGTGIPPVGEGTWYLGENREFYEEEKNSLITGLKAGMTLIDTAEMYGLGKAEMLVGNAIKGMARGKLFLVSKVLPGNAGRKNIFRSCEKTLRNLQTDYLDLYLLHWRGRVPLEETVTCLEELKAQGKIRRWGVSNFNLADMEELWQLPDGNKCFVNQDLYHIASRGIEYDLLPWLKEHDVPLMAYCPLGQAELLEKGLHANSLLNRIAQKHQATAAQIMLAFVIRSGNVIAIPRTGNASHAAENAAAMELKLDEEDLKKIDAEFPPPKKRVPLDMR